MTIVEMTAPVDVGVRQAVLHATVRLINTQGPAQVSLAAVAIEANTPEEVVAEHFADAQTLFAAIIGSVRRSHHDALCATISRRRSLTDSVSIALHAFWRVAESHTAEHQAAKQILLYELSDNTHRRSVGAPLYELYVSATEHWLTTIEHVHCITWERPARELAQLLLATLDGLTTAHLCTRNSTELLPVLDLFAYQFAQHARRAAKTGKL